MMSMSDEEIKVSFSAPTITRKEYIVKGPSGWPETFKRDACDRALTTFVGSVAVKDLVDVFLTRRRVADKAEPIEWYTIVGYLGRTFGVSPNGVPHEAGIAFWAHVTLAQRAEAMN